MYAFVKKRMRKREKDSVREREFGMFKYVIIDFISKYYCFVFMNLYPKTKLLQKHTLTLYPLSLVYVYIYILSHTCTQYIFIYTYTPTQSCQDMHTHLSSILT